MTELDKETKEGCSGCFRQVMDDGREIKREGNDEEEGYRCDGREERNLGMEKRVEEKV